MPINYWRCIDVDHDNHHTNQCLQCGEKFVGYCGREWKFCPLCGTCWVGQIELSQRLKNLHRMWDSQKYVHRSHWIIQRREWAQWPDEERKYTNWYIEHTFEPNVQVSEVFRYLKSLRSTYNGETFEFRACIKSSTPPFRAVHSNCE